jgi:FtsZ-interacting cell division protein ZipA
MSELQLGLLIISVVIVAAVLLYNKIEQVRMRRRTEAAFGSKHDDVLLDRVSPESVDDGGRIEHTLGIAAADADAARPSPPVPPQASNAALSLPPAALDSRVDFIVALDLPRAYPVGRVAEQAESSLELGLRTPVHWEAYDTDQQRWLPVQAQHSYSQLRAGLQLANRGGAAAEEEVVAFLVGMQELALALSGEIEAPEVGEAMASAAALDRFCADHDIQIGLSVLGREGATLPGTKIRALAESQGCVLAKDGRYHKPGDQGETLYALSNAEPMPFHPETLKSLNTRGVVLTLDVPRAPGAPTTFRSYIEFARQLAHALDGVLVDDDSKAISDGAADQIAEQLNVIHQAMAARGMPAGGPLALRLFA